MKKILIALVVLVAAGVGYFVFFAKWSEPRGGQADGEVGQGAALIAEKTRTGALAAEADRKKEKRKVKIPAEGGIIEIEEAEGDMAPEDEKRMDAISDAMDEDNFTAVVALIPDVQTSTNAEVRSEMVDALGSFGKKALVELLPFMADPDSDVAENARDQWTMALSDVSNERSKCKYIEAAMGILTDEDALDSMMTELTDCDDYLAIQTIVNIISSGTPQAVAAAKEQYEFITGEEYTNIADAETWLQENYEPDEEE